MPKGHCRYILLNPEIKGLRCACVGFSHNVDIPGATCHCGHLACFHNKESDAPPDQTRQEIELLRQRLQQLEEQLARSQEEVLDSVVSRLGQVEDHLEKSREEVGEQIKNAHRNISVSWHSIRATEARTREHDEQLRAIVAKLRDHDEQLDRVHAGQLELRDADLSLEERIENVTEMLEDQQQQIDELEEQRQLEEAAALSVATRPTRRRSTSDTSRPLVIQPQQQQQQQQAQQQTVRPLGQGAARSPTTASRSPSGGPITVTTPRGPGDGSDPDGGRPATVLSNASHSPTAAAGSSHPLQPLHHLSPRLPPPIAAPSKTGVWTVHISLLPHKWIPMPFERNTPAYQRCLSRGLHQMVAVQGRSAEAFKTAVERAFARFLRGREWMPLQAKLCDAATLQGLPMLRQLDDELMAMKNRGSGWDHEFLRRYCAVVDANGVIDSLYIAMCEHTISWHTLKHSPVFMEGLEACWKFDPLLDTDPYDEDMGVDDEARPAAGDIIRTAIKPPLKRTLGEMSRSNSFGGGNGPASGPGAVTAPAGVVVPDVTPEDQARVKRACPAPPQGAIVEIRRRDIKTA
jgi:hypothetical protein